MAAKKKVKVADAAYSVTFTIGVDTHTGEGASILEALQAVKPTNYRGLAKIMVTENGVAHDIPIKLTPIFLQRLFARPIDLELFAKRLSVLL